MADVQSPFASALGHPILGSKDFLSGHYAHQVSSYPLKSPAPTPTVWTLPASRWTSKCHPRVDEVSQEVDGYFLQHWPFPDDKSRKVFLKAGFSRVTCLYFPLAKDDRIHFACRLLTVLFLIDDVLEEMSLAEGEKYNAKLIPISRGEVLPNRRSTPLFLSFFPLSILPPFFLYSFSILSPFS